MKEFLALLRVQLKVNSPRNVFSNRDNKKQRRVLAMLLVMLLAFGQMGYLAYVILNGLVVASLQLGVPEMALALSFLVGSLMVAVFGIFETMGRLFMARDGEFLSALPAKPRNVFLAKLTVVYLYELLYSLLFVALPIILLGIRGGYGPLYYVGGLFVLLLFPVLPVLAGALVSLIIMRLSAGSRDRDKFVTVVSIVAMLLAVGLQLSISRIMPGAIKGDFFLNLLQNSQQTLAGLTAAWPPALWMAKLLTGSLLNGLWFVLATGAGLLLALLIAGALYQRGLQASLENNATVKAKTRRGPEGTLSPVKAIARRELRTILRVPAYAFNSLAGVIMAPIMILSLLVTGSNNNTGMSLNAILTAVRDPKNFLVTALGIAAFLLFVGGINMAGATMLSREGRARWLLKVVPLPAQTVVQGKLLASLQIGFLNLGVSLLLALLASPLQTLAACLIGLPLCAAVTYVGLYIDISNPKFNWNDYTQAIKQNLNGVFMMMISWGLLGLFAVAAVMLANELGLWLIPLLTAASLLLCYLARMLLYKKGVAHLEQLEG